MSEIAFSVIVPTYNRADLIGDTLRSILDQTFPPAEVIVVDDGSTDNTEEVVGKVDRAVRYIRILNSGENKARNIGVSQATAPLVALCDSDDLWVPEKLERFRELFLADPSLNYAYSNFRFVTGDEWSDETKFDTAPAGYWRRASRRLGDESWAYDEPQVIPLVEFQPIFPSAAVIPRAVYTELGGYDAALGRTGSNDFEFHLRCARRPPIGVVGLPLVGIRKHAGNISRDQLWMTTGEVQVLRQFLERSGLEGEERQVVEDAIAFRSASVVDLAFAAGRPELVRDYAAAAGRYLSPKLRLKSAIATMPESICGPVSRAALLLSGLRR